MFLKQLTEELKSKGSFKIVFLGDSITSEEWVHPNWREIVEYVLKEEVSSDNWQLSSWGIRCINSGFDGSSTRDWLNKQDTDVTSYNPDMVIMMGTINDMDYKIPVEETVQNLKTLLANFSSKIKCVVYATDIGSNNDAYNARYKERLGQIRTLFNMDGGGLFVDMFEEFAKLDRARLFTLVNLVGNSLVGIKPGEMDFLHPNSLGNAYIAKILLNKVFGIKFDPEKYMQEVAAEKMFPAY